MLFVSLTVCLFVSFKALSPRRQTARTKSTDKQHIFPCHAKQFCCRRIVDATQTEKHFRDNKELHLSMFGFRSSWSNMGNVLATSLLPST